ncbi:diaminopimelate decarboxylase [Candidatus Neoehrlichia lotoris str. RAC413]|uniref:Diaminopimelate decarboxylase n=2 Tax=Candidatus Neoehrlichia procyonis TaxID=467750 RepID=A0A0F3NMI4_9RICK|nr:diaminopimelate decarboxylase [Candidatus Neoehrlichia lotoris str. RAC413]
MLHVENVNVLEVVKSFGTPTYCYSLQTIKDNYYQFRNNLPSNSTICYSIKANPNLSIIRLLSQWGAGADVVSEGEIRRAMLAGIPANKIIFSGVGKTTAEISFAMDQKILQFNVESIEELHLINQIANQKNIIVSVAIRINPSIDANTHEKINTGLKTHKFGIPEDCINQVLSYSFSNLQIIGIAVHIGSQIYDLSIFKNVVNKIKKIVKTFRDYNIKILRVDIGGGLGISYGQQKSCPTIKEYSFIVKENFFNEEYEIICEPGRAIIGNAGILLTKVLYRKNNSVKNHIIVDAGMNDLIRPALYNAQHEIIPIIYSNDNNIVADIVGPICESDDFFAYNYYIQNPKVGDILAICTAGAYGSSMSSNYNSKLLAEEVLVHDDTFCSIRKRQSYDMMLSNEIENLIK